MTESTTPPVTNSTAVAKRKIDLYKLRNLLLSRKINAQISPGGKENYLYIQSENGYQNGIEIDDSGEMATYWDIKPGSDGWTALRIIDQFIHAPLRAPVDFALGHVVRVINKGSRDFNRVGIVVRINHEFLNPITVSLHIPGYDQRLEVSFVQDELEIYEDDRSR